MNTPVDYNEYKMTRKEKGLYIIIAVTVIYLTGFVFFRSHIISSILCPLAIFYPRLKVKDIIAKRKIELNNQFKDMLYSLSSSLSAGKSVEGASIQINRQILSKK
jgi:tight adherence protein B